MMMAHVNPEKPSFDRELDQFPAEWKEEFQRLSTLILDLAEQYGDRLHIQLWDPRSLQGMINSFRYKVRQYPTFIVNRSKKIAGWDIENLKRALKAATSIEMGEKLPT